MFNPICYDRFYTIQIESKVSKIGERESELSTQLKLEYLLIEPAFQFHWKHEFKKSLPAES